MATFCPKHGSSTKAVLPESENPAGCRRRDVPAILKPSNFIWGGGGDVLGHQLTYLAGGEGGFINQELPLHRLCCLSIDIGLRVQEESATHGASLPSGFSMRESHMLGCSRYSSPHSISETHTDGTVNRCDHYFYALAALAPSKLGTRQGCDCAGLGLGRPPHVSAEHCPEDLIGL